MGITIGLCRILWRLINSIEDYAKHVELIKEAGQRWQDLHGEKFTRDLILIAKKDYSTKVWCYLLKDEYFYHIIDVNMMKQSGWIYQMCNINIIRDLAKDI